MEASVCSEYPSIVASQREFVKLWVMDDLADWHAYEGHEAAGIVNDQLSRVDCAYHTYFAVPQYDCQSWRVPCDRRSMTSQLYLDTFLHPCGLTYEQCWRVSG